MVIIYIIIVNRSMVLIDIVVKEFCLRLFRRITLENNANKQANQQQQQDDER